mgnify:CR=1 FL=1
MVSSLEVIPKNLLLPVIQENLSEDNSSIDDNVREPCREEEEEKEEMGDDRFVIEGRGGGRQAPQILIEQLDAPRQPVIAQDPIRNEVRED